MSDFYKDFLYNKDQATILNKAYKGVFDLLLYKIQEIDRNNIVSKILTYQKIRFQRIDATNAMYTINSILNDASLLTSLGINPYSSLEIKRNMWNNMSKIEKANLIDMAGYSIMLTSIIKLPDNNQTEVMNYNVVDFELSDMSNNTFIKDVDYVFYDNKLILLKEFSLDDAYKRKFLILKNIIIDTNVSESKLGTSLEIPFSDDFTKTDYNEIMKGFVRAAAGGPTLKNLDSSLGGYKALEGTKVIDKYNATSGDKNLWSYEKSVKQLTPFDFLVSVPVSFLYKPERLNYINKFFSQIKPAYSNFIYAPNLLVLDALKLSEKDDIISFNSLYTFNDKLDREDFARFVYNISISKESIISDISQYDMPYGYKENLFDDDFEYDSAIPFCEIISALDKKIAGALKTTVKDIIKNNDSVKTSLNLTVLNVDSAFDTMNVNDETEMVQYTSPKDSLKPISVFRFDDNIEFDEEYVEAIYDTYFGDFNQVIYDNVCIKLIPKN